jgi:hypothetical protein
MADGGATVADLTQLAAFYGAGATSVPTKKMPADAHGKAGAGAAATAYTTADTTAHRHSTAFTEFDKQLGDYLFGLAGSNSKQKAQIQSIVANLESELAALPDTPAGNEMAGRDIANALSLVEAIVHLSHSAAAAVSEKVDALAERYLGFGIPTPPPAADTTSAGAPVDPGTYSYSGYSGGGSGNGGGQGAPAGVMSISTAAITGDAESAMAQVAANFGWGRGTAEWQALVNLENGEAGFRPGIANPSSGALGLAQALGHGQSDTAGSLGNEYGGYGLTAAQSQAANSGNAADQALWMCNYIKATYGDPISAWNDWESRYPHWY